ncbi:uncharacterized protein LOC106012182 [Aplysia californica]|uniref:Uncharacterized protein LOC106012182 n=1 Tax=Aplysia californica TaxID=6500 RepID=A0ABM1A2X4_APLCA|nr:uncharacterized protein LOC106012182 [Aplysia californica]
MWLSVSGHVAICLALAISPHVWLFFIASAWLGFFRAVTNTVPYILANQISREQTGDKNTGVAIALVAAMLPCAFALCSAIMGPLMHVTKDAGVPIYYSSVNGILGLLFFVFIKLRQ